VAQIVEKSRENFVVVVGFVLTVVMPYSRVTFGGVPVQASYLQPHSWWLLRNPLYLSHFFATPY